MVNKPVKILLVEDNPADVRWIAEVFKDLHIKNELYVVKDGINAMNYLYHREGYKNAPCPDIILLDLNLPCMGGHEVLKEIKSDKNLKSTPVVILTASNFPDDIRNAYKNYADYYVTKPVDFEHAMKILRCITA